jgi:hypothetical protein
LKHSIEKDNNPPLRMIIQGITGARKSYLIGCIKETLSSTKKFLQNPLLLLALTNVATFNIQAYTIHSPLHSYKYFLSLEGKSLSSLQEDLKHIQYILIEKMSFIGPTIFSHINEHLQEAFSLYIKTPHFGSFSIIPFRDLGQLPPIKDIPLYPGTFHGSTL